MSSSGYLPGRQADLLAWSTTFDGHINADPTMYGLTIEQAGQFNTLHQAFADAYFLSQDDATRTPSVIQTKRDAMAALKSEARVLAKIIQAYPGTTNTMRTDLGLTVPDTEPTPVPPPTERPVMEFEDVSGHTVQLRLHSDDSLRRKPEGVAGASLFSHVGDAPPADLSDWAFEGSTTRTSFDVSFPPLLAPGTKVWLTAFWFNAKMESGPACTPRETYIGFGGVSQAA